MSVTLPDTTRIVTDLVYRRKECKEVFVIELDETDLIIRAAGLYKALTRMKAWHTQLAIGAGTVFDAYESASMDMNI